MVGGKLLPNSQFQQKPDFFKVFLSPDLSWYILLIDKFHFLVAFILWDIVNMCIASNC